MKVFGTDYDGTIINIEPEKSKEFGRLLQKEWSVDASEAAKYWIDTGVHQGVPSSITFLQKFLVEFCLMKNVRKIVNNGYIIVEY